MPPLAPERKRDRLKPAAFNLNVSFPLGVKIFASFQSRHTLSCPKFPWAHGVQKFSLVGKLFLCETILAKVGIFHLGVSGALLMFVKRSKCTV